MYDKCIFCENNVEATSISDKDAVSCKCHNCGEYEITSPAIKSLPYDLDGKYKDKKYLISGYLRERTEEGLSTEITLENFESLITSIRTKLLGEKLERLLSLIYKRTEFYGQELRIDISQPALIYAKNVQEFPNLITMAEELEYIKVTSRTTEGSIMPLKLTSKGYEKAEELQKKIIGSKQCFAAMWFDGEMLNIYDNIISKAIRDAGYAPFLIINEEHNDDINDRIIAEIRKSKFLVADFTGNRGGVYFEAGFAYGLGLPVIWTCREDWFNKEVPKESDVEINGEIRKGTIQEKRFIHFDVDHYNFIVWKTGEDLYEKLKNRILATILA